MYTFFILVTLNIQGLKAQKFSLEVIAQGFETPVAIKNAGDSRLFIVEKHGTIKILNADGTINSANFLDIDARVGSRSNEQGLLGIAFHPKYTLSHGGFVFVNYTDNEGDTTIAKFYIEPNSEVVDPQTEVVIMKIEQPYSNHNAGDLAFGRDGYLYIGTGDGGSGGDPKNRAQNGQSLLGKMLRIDVDHGNPYAVPSDNPYVNNSKIRDEIWAIGLRNPWKYSFDEETGELWIADVGQNKIEEINKVESEPLGLNFGWRCYEGNSDYEADDCNGNRGELVFPYVEYEHDKGRCSLTGGYVYRGEENPNLQGYYVFADFCTNEIGRTNTKGSLNFQKTEVRGIATFGEDDRGELYLAGMYDGQVYKLTFK